jgi:hypothetical protein
MVRSAKFDLPFALFYQINGREHGAERGYNPVNVGRLAKATEVPSLEGNN